MIFQTIMYTLIFSVIGIVLIKMIYDKIKYGKFFEEENADQKNDGEQK